MKQPISIEQAMQVAIEQAKLAGKQGDVPVGAVVLQHGRILAKAYNKKEKKQNALQHAEMIAIARASKKLKNFRLDDCTLVVTKEPCLMCMGALLSARVPHLVFGSYDKKFGNLHLASQNNFNHTCTVQGGVLEQQTSKLLSDFFADLRNKKRQNGHHKKGA